jgi:hypothetical protein
MGGAKLSSTYSRCLHGGHLRGVKKAIAQAAGSDTFWVAPEVFSSHVAQVVA